jgi:hypothetical protein
VGAATVVCAVVTVLAPVVVAVLVLVPDPVDEAPETQSNESKYVSFPLFLLILLALFSPLVC